jgi:hypothetical protein
LWSVARLSLTERVSKVYDLNFLTSFRQALDSSFDANMPYADTPFPYPPFFLFLLRPLGLMSYSSAYFSWVLLTFLLFGFVALASTFAKWRLPVAVVLLLAPSTVYTITFGQNGFLSAALLAAGLRFAEPRPALAGFLLGLSSFKPQLGVLIPIALASAGLWRAFAAASLTVLLLIGASGTFLGWSMWQDWIFAVIGLTGDIQLHAQNIYHLMPTAMANLLMLGTAWPVARAVQLVIALIVGITTWLTFRRGVHDLGIAALLVGTVVASPYAFIYDMPMVTIAVLSVIQERERSEAYFALPEIMILATTLVLPYLMVSRVTPVPPGAMVLCALFCLVVRRIVILRSVPIMRREIYGNPKHVVMATCAELSP